MKNNDEGVGATEFDLPNSQNPRPQAPIFHTNERVPRPTNNQAKITNHAKVMGQVLDAK